MNDRIENIIQELYVIDPSLHEHDAAVRKIVSALLVSRPDTKFDEAFAGRLRGELLATATRRQMQGEARGSGINTITFNPMKKFMYLLGGAVLAAIVIVPAVYLSSQRTGVPGRLTPGFRQDLSSASSVRKVADGAFGALAPTGAFGEAAGTALGRGGGGGSATSASVQGPAGFGGGVSADSKIAPGPFPPQDFMTYTYVYKGGDITLDGGTVDVLKRVKGYGNAATLGNIIRSFDVAGIDLKGFSDAVVSSLTFVQNKAFGYMISVNTYEGMVSVNENWEKWYPPCTINGCPEQPRLTLADVPSDADLIALADAFTAEHKIDLSSYGAPEVLNDWRVWYEQTPNKSDAYVPDSITVSYPLMIGGKRAYDEGGYPVGLKVNVNIRFKKVIGVYELTTQQYESSSYAAEADVQKILSIAERGGVYGYMPEGGRVVEVPLGDPTYSYMKFWQYTGGQSNELLVPALVFPVTQQVEGMYRANVIVPLAQELLNMPQPGPITIMEGSVR